MQYVLLPRSVAFVGDVRLKRAYIADLYILGKGCGFPQEWRVQIYGLVVVEANRDLAKNNLHLALGTIQSPKGGRFTADVVSRRDPYQPSKLTLPDLSCVPVTLEPSYDKRLGIPILKVRQ